VGPGATVAAMAVAAALAAAAPAAAQQGAEADPWSPEALEALLAAHVEEDEEEVLAATIRAHDSLVEIMHAHVAGDRSAPDYPFVMSYVDEENLELVVMMHVMAMLAGIEYSEEELHVALGTDHPGVEFNIVYGTFEPDSSWVRVESWRQYYLERCVPEPQPDHAGSCAVHAKRLRDSGAEVPGQDPGASAAEPASELPPAPARGTPDRGTTAPARAAQPATQATPAVTVRGGMALSESPTGAAGEGRSAAGTTGIAVNFGNATAMVVSSHFIDGIVEGAGSPAGLVLRGAGARVPVDAEVLATTDIVGHTAVSSDAAIVRLGGAGIAPAVGEIQNGTSTIAVSSYGGVGGLLGQDAEIVGAVTRGGGAIAGDNVAIRGLVAGHDRVITDQAIAAYQAARGDSGAPVVHTGADGRPALLGVHVGTVQTFAKDYDGQVVPWPQLSVHGTGGEYGVFSTWENVERDLGLPRHAPQA